MAGFSRNPGSDPWTFKHWWSAASQQARALGKRSLGGRERDAIGKLARAGSLLPLGDLSAPSLGGFGPDAAAAAYLQSYAFIDHLVARHGERSLVRFWSAVVRSRSLERGARIVYRSDLAELEAAFLAAARDY